jgi:hypothetical protein
MILSDSKAVPCRWERSQYSGALMELWVQIARRTCTERGIVIGKGNRSAQCHFLHPVHPFTDLGLNPVSL